MNSTPEGTDDALDRVVGELVAADPGGTRIGRVVRDSFDMLYNGQRTGRYAPEQLFKTEKTHVGSVFEIELRRALAEVIHDGTKLDYRIANEEVDCKFSFRMGGWMLPPECIGELLLVVTADDRQGLWSAGVVRARPEHLRLSTNRDAKTSLSSAGREAIHWIGRNAELPINVLLHLNEADKEAVFAPRSGQQRVNELFRRAQLIPISRNAVATVAQQDDFMKRVRYNGGARSALQAEGFLIPGGDYESHRRVALDLGAPDIEPGEFVSFRVVPTPPGSTQAVKLDSSWWRIAEPHEAVTLPAPMLPSTHRSRS